MTTKPVVLPRGRFAPERFVQVEVGAIKIKLTMVEATILVKSAVVFFLGKSSYFRVFWKEPSLSSYRKPV